MKIALSIPGFGKIDSGLPVPTGGLETGQIIIMTFVVLTIIIAILLSLYFVGKGGLELIQSNGRKEKIESGRNRIIYAIFGLIMIFLSFVLINAFSNFFGYDLLCIVFKPLSSNCEL